jgi:hypothetical protein
MQQGKAKRTIACESPNHATHNIVPKAAWRCNLCNRILCSRDGAADDMPDACDTCWAEAHQSAA